MACREKKNLMKDVLKTIKKYNLIQENDKIVVGVSGGPDSMTMLDIFVNIKKSEKIRFDFVVAHVNHMIREEAKEDEKYVEKYCKNKGIDFYSKSIDVEKIANTNKESVEEAGRNARYKFFDEVLVDEYQDSNSVQETIIDLVSRRSLKEANVFMVGDVKQSIYRFRQAMPRLFLDKYNNYEKIELDETERNVPINGRKIQLFKNFRSRDNILDFTNLVFKNIMSETLGEVEYDRNEYLNFGAEDYQKVNQNLKTEIDIIEVKKDDQDLYENNENDTEEDDYGSNNKNSEDIEDLKHLDEIEVEAKYVAKKVKELIDSKYQVYDRKSKSFRDIKYKDIAILLRSTKNKANIFEQEIMNNGMPVFSDSTQEYLESIEIQTIMSLLKIIDNPMQDIPLVTVLRSHIGKFTDNELIEIRLADKYSDFYNAMKKFITRAAVVILIGGMSVAIGGCYGPFRLTSKLHHWNGQVSQKKFVNELVFLGMCIIPAYEICILGDGLIFNSIEWWGGRNPISMKDGQQEEVKFAYEGQEYKVTKTKDQMTIALVNSDQKVDFRYFPEEKSWYQMNGENKVKVVEMKGKQVYTYLPNAKTLVFDESNMEEVETQVMSAR